MNNSMEIVILDGYTLNPGDLSWKALEQLGNVTNYDRTSTAEIVQRAIHADILLTNKTKLSAETIIQLPNLKYIGVLATGYDVIDVKTAAQQGIVVSNVPGYGTSSVAQMVFALLLEFCQHPGLHNEAVRAGEWASSKDWCFWKKPLIELEGKTIGIVGYGRIGQQTGNIARAFGMKVAAIRSDRHPIEALDVVWCSREELLACSDVLTLHCPLTPQTERMINKESLSTMKKNAFLINTSRGMLIDEQDLADALNQEVIAGAGLDVLSMEPPASNHPLVTAKNCIITPHIAWASIEAREKLLGNVISNVEGFLSGKPQNVITI